ncbi:hypothetical protein ABC382_00425 [Lysinibacillus sp. 1P01SD]|uniref:CD3337/EF1877 family mobilome membrane protein n=1 Tax=Lysinibacillus sp. 1P01SD TaxID=3132285 RepID=UPI0039A2E7C5
MKEKAQKVVSIISGKFKATSTFRKSALIFLFTVLLTATFFFSLDVEQQKTEAEINAVGTVIGEQYAKEYGTFKGASGKTYYYLDAVTQDEIDSADDGWFESIWKGALAKIQVIENVGKQINMYLNNIVNALFKMNIFFTVAMITAFDLGSNFNIIDGMIDAIDGSIFKITGITNGGAMTNGGIFGAFINVIIALTGGYAIYMLVISRKVISGVKAIFQVTICLALSVILLSNFGYYMKGINSITTDLSNDVMTAVTPTSAHNANDPTGVKNTLWSMFVERPYLYMQYGQGQVGGELTKSRIENLLGYDPLNGDVDDESGRKYYVIKEEIGKHSNTLMTEHSVMDKLSFSVVYLAVNGIVSIPIYAMALFMVLLQFWFIVIAGLAPFALLVGCIPSMANVLKRYAIELVLPLGLKIGFSFVSIFVMMMATYVFEYSNANLLGSSNILLSYISVMFMFIILFLTIFILRNRIMSIFTKGSAMLNGLREGAGQLTTPLTNTVKGAVQGGATVAGAVVGGLATGGAGIMTGAKIGGAIGGTLTGEKSVGDAIGTSVQSVHRHKLMSNLAENGYERGLPTNMANDSFNKQMEAIQQIEDKEQRQEAMEQLMSKNGIGHEPNMESNDKADHDLVPLYASTANTEQQPSRMYEQLEHDRIEKEKIAQQIDGEDNVVTYDIEQLQHQEDRDDTQLEERDIEVVHSTDDGTIVTVEDSTNDEDIKDQHLYSLNTESTTAQSTSPVEGVQISKGSSEASERVDIKVDNETKDRNYDEETDTFKGARLDEIDNPNSTSVETSSQQPQVDSSKIEQAKTEAEADLRNAQRIEQQAQEEHVKAQDALAQAQANAQQNVNDANAQQVLANAEKAEEEAQMHLMHTQQERQNAEQKARDLENIQNPTLEGSSTPINGSANVESNPVSQRDIERKTVEAELLKDEGYSAVHAQQQQQMREAQTKDLDSASKLPTATSMGGGNANTASVTTSLESTDLKGSDLNSGSTAGGNGTRTEAVSLEEQSELHASDLNGADVNSSPLESKSLENTTLESSSAEGSDLKATPLNTANENVSAIPSQPLQSTPLQGSESRGSSVEGTQLKSTPLGTPNDNSSAVKNQPLQSTPLKGSNLGNGGSVEGTQLKSTPLKTPQDQPSVTQSQPLQSAPLRGSDLSNVGSTEGQRQRPSTNETNQEQVLTQRNNVNEQSTGLNSNTNLTALNAHEQSTQDSDED